MKPSKIRVLGSCKDPGGAEAIAPILSSLSSDSRFEVIVVAQKNAIQVIKSHGLSCLSMEDDFNAKTPGCEVAASILESTEPELLLIGTSKGLNLGKYLVEMSRARGTHSVAILDSWINYYQRFSGPAEEERFRFIPDKIAVIDEFSRTQMLVEGFPDDSIVVTGPGTPYLDRLHGKAESLAQNATIDLRETLKLDATTELIMFVSQPMSGDYGEDTTLPEHFGYTEQIAFRDLLELIESEPSLKDVVVLAKHHPREDKTSFDAIIEDSNVRVIKAPDLDKLLLLQSVDLVVGMSSILLVESLLLDCLTLSYQPNLSRENPIGFLENMGICPLALSKTELRKTITKLRSDSAFLERMSLKRAEFRVDGGARNRILGYLYQHLGVEMIEN